MAEQRIECPRCTENYKVKNAIEALHSPSERDFTFERRKGALSRRDNKTLICTLCGKAEALQDVVSGLTWYMVRIAVEKDYQLARRLPKGVPAGIMGVMGTGEFTQERETEK